MHRIFHFSLHESRAPAVSPAKKKLGKFPQFLDSRRYGRRMFLPTMNKRSKAVLMFFGMATLASAQSRSVREIKNFLIDPSKPYLYLEELRQALKDVSIQPPSPEENLR